MPAQQDEGLFFDAGRLPPPENAYVAWLDMMGTRAIMSRSLPITANFIFKLHTAVLEAPHADMRLYPVMDGVYIVATRQGALREFLCNVFARVADTFVSTRDIHHRFVIKCAIAYGPVLHGQSVPPEANFTLDNNQAYRDSILLGMPMIQAFLGESNAPPYGVYVHESARAFSPEEESPFRHVWWKWFLPASRALAQQLASELELYFEWCRQRWRPLEYPEERIRVHREMGCQYFTDLEQAPNDQ
ncbi:MAG: hypothetical protein GXP25_23180 [Planctomycetes bacterium]|nr:hypothetical protein [Planctomycetota bacterium]